MFGYVRPDRAEMKVKEYDAYRAFYCALCRQLGKEYGVAARLALNYDCTFLVILYQAMYGGKCTAERKRCTCNPLKKCYYALQAENALSYGALVTVLLTEQKLRDDMQDEAFGKRLIARLIFMLTTHCRKKARRKDAALFAFLSEQTELQQKTEQLPDCGLDRAAEPSAKMLQRILTQTAQTERQRRILEVLGYQLGRWVYFADALDDLKKDIRKKSYNPFARKYHLTEQSEPSEITEAQEDANQWMNQSVAQISSAFHLLDFSSPQPILENIIDLGLAETQHKLMTKEEKKQYVRPI